MVVLNVTWYSLIFWRGNLCSLGTVYAVDIALIEKLSKIPPATAKKKKKGSVSGMQSLTISVRPTHPIQCLKCLIPVKTMAIPALSAASITS